jgi:acrylyl-CoA reductase (NADPH)
MNSEFAAYLVEKDSAGKVHGTIRAVSPDNLTGEVLIRVQWTSLNYKDALAATGHPGVARRLPHVPGIDAAGVVAEVSSDFETPEFAVGDEVLVTGYELGAGQWGGWSEYIRVPTSWVIKKPQSLTLRDTMVLGTAGFTAAQCVDSLQLHGIAPSHGAIVVTGATGGVGCVGVMLLAKLGYRVVAVTGKSAAHERLKAWGASEILGREDVIDSSGKPMLPGRWAGALDTVGGATLATIIRQTHDHGCVTACGLVGGTDLALSVYPFILRGVTLAGITSSGCPRSARIEIWKKLAGPWRLGALDAVTTEINLDQVADLVPKILKGEIVGRTVIKVN